MISWKNRYSDTEKFDSFNRWQRIGYFNDYKIATISGFIIVDTKMYIAYLHFPSSMNGNVETFKSEFFEECEAFVSSNWEKFIKDIKQS